MTRRQVKRRFYARMGRRSIKISAQRFVRKHVYLEFKPGYGWIAHGVKSKHNIKEEQ